MAPSLPSVVVLLLCVTLAPCVYGGDDCESYTDSYNIYHPSKSCWIGFCCGECNNRYCCNERFRRLTESQQDFCFSSSNDDISYTPLPMIFSFASIAVVFLIIICCCVCPCCCLYKMCRKPRPVIATTTHTTVVTSTPHYPPQPTASLGQPQAYQGAQYPPYQPVPVQMGYGAPPPTSAPYPAKTFTAGPPPTYQEATGPAFSPTPMPYSQAAFSTDQPSYPLQPPYPPQPSGPPAHADYLAQPAYNPDYVAAPRTG